jgi:hypothetical protein
MTDSRVVPTRGERNNNPGNLNYLLRDAWRGQLGLEIVPPGETFTPRFGRYDTAANGIRAVAGQLLAYQRRDHVRAIRGLIGRWAPSRDHNDTGAYVAAVCNHAGLGPDDDCDLSNPDNLSNMVFAIIRQENGRCLYDADTLAAACAAALS